MDQPVERAAPDAGERPERPVGAVVVPGVVGQRHHALGRRMALQRARQVDDRDLDPFGDRHFGQPPADAAAAAGDREAIAGGRRQAGEIGGRERHGPVSPFAWFAVC